ncbi:MAG TPA: hypothetical protein VKI17_08505 [Gemmataceae bacterium]|nr:hypothetical protein [Gemmataceae bacterium]
MKTSNLELRRDSGALVPHFNARFRQFQVEKDESTAEIVREPAADHEGAKTEESLIPDPRGQLRPSEHVERKLSVLLRNTALPVSFLLARASSSGQE